LNAPNMDGSTSKYPTIFKVKDVLSAVGVKEKNP